MIVLLLYPSKLDSKIKDHSKIESTFITDQTQIEVHQETIKPS